MQCRSTRLPAWRALRFLLPTLLWGTLSACYAYTPAHGGPVPGGERVRAYLTASGRERVGELLPADQRWLEGTVVRHGPRGLVLRVPSPDDPANPTSRQLEQEISLAEGDVAAVEIRELDGLKTGLVAGIAAVAVGSVLGAVLSGDSGGSGGGGGGGGTDALIPATPPTGAGSPPP